jgi:hypothetical protein
MRVLSVAVACVAGCTKDAPPTQHARSEGVEAAREPSGGAPSELRTLGPNATFADLVRAARSLATGADRDSSAGCMLERSQDGGYVLAADLMLALERMPDPPTDLGALLERDARPIAMLTAFGTIRPQAEQGLALASFTTTAPGTQTAVLLALDHDVAFVRTSAAASADAAGEPVSSAAARALALVSSGRSTLFVSASASTPLSNVHALLALLSPSAAVGLAVLLPHGTALPRSDAGGALDALADVACPDGLPEVALDTPLGDLDASALGPSLHDLQADIAPCLAAMQVEAARVVLALRIAQDGSVAHACLLDAAGLDAHTAGCLVLAARSLVVPAPSPAGLVDLHLPLALHAEGPAAQRALCL